MDLSQLCKHITHIWLQKQHTEPRDTCKCKLPPRKYGVNTRTLGKIRIECQRKWNSKNKKCEMRKRPSSGRANEEVQRESIANVGGMWTDDLTQTPGKYTPFLSLVFLNIANWIYWGVFLEEYSTWRRPMRERQSKIKLKKGWDTNAFRTSSGCERTDWDRRSVNTSSQTEVNHVIFHLPVEWHT